MAVYSVGVYSSTAVACLLAHIVQFGLLGILSLTPLDISGPFSNPGGSGSTVF